MAVTLRDLYKILDAVDHHARAITRMHTELRALLAQVSIPETADHPCPQCGVPLAGERALAFHCANVHGGPAIPLSPDEERA